jgi:hypothetical protein
MAIKEGFDYIDISWKYVQNKLNSLILSEFKQKPYLAPQKTPSKSSFRIWKNNVEPEEIGPNDWRKIFEVDISYYIEIDESEQGYKHLYQESEHLYQLIHNNQITIEQIKWLAGTIEETEIEKIEDGVYAINMLFTCVVYKSLFLEEKALLLDGVDDYLIVGGFEYDFYNSGNTKPFTVSAWVKLSSGLDDTTDYKGAVLTDNTKMAVFAIQYVHATSKMRITGSTGGIGESNMRNGYEYLMPYDTDWHHIIWTGEQPTWGVNSEGVEVGTPAKYFCKNKLYIDGEQVQINYGDGHSLGGVNRGTGTYTSATQTWATNANFDEQTSEQLYRTTVTLRTDNSLTMATALLESVPSYFEIDESAYIGKSRGASSYHQGSLSDIAFWTVALDADEVKTIYNKGFPCDIKTQKANLKAWWRMGDGNGDIMPSTSNFSSILDQTTPFELSDNISIYNGGDVDVDAYVSVSGGDTTGAIEDGSYYKFQFTITNYVSGGFRIRQSSGADVISTYGSHTGNGNGNYEFYLKSLNTNKFVIDAYNFGFEGTISNYKVFKVTTGQYRALPENMDFNSQTTGVPYHYFMQTDKYSLDFDGSNDYFDVGNPLNLNLDVDSITLSAWIKYSGKPSAGKYYTILYLRDKDLATDRIALQVAWAGGGASSTIGIVAYDGTLYSDYSSNYGNFHVNADNVYNDNRWHHIVGISNKGVLSLYIDGVYQETNATTTMHIVSNMSGFKISDAHTTSVTSNYNGLISQVAVWDTSISSEDVKAIYNNGDPIMLDKDFSTLNATYNKSHHLIRWYRMGDGKNDELLSANLMKDTVLWNQVGSLEFGEEMVTNGDFKNGMTGWTIGNLDGGYGIGAEVINNQLVLTGTSAASHGASDYITQADIVPRSSNKWYKLIIEVDSISEGQWGYTANGSYTYLGRNSLDFAGEVKEYFYYDNSSADLALRIYPRFYSGTNNVLVINKISIKEAKGDIAQSVSMGTTNESSDVPK